MTILEIAKRIISDSTISPNEIQFTKKAEDLESYPEEGMRALLVGARIIDEDVVVLTMDYRKFDEFNKTIESSNYYDKSGVPRLTAREAGCYQPVDDLYMAALDKVSDYFSFLEENTLFNQYIADPDGANSYVEWLENKVKQS